MLESFREGRVAPVLPLLMALACQPGPVQPDVQSDTDSISDYVEISVDDILDQCNEEVPLTGRPYWTIEYQDPNPPSELIPDSTFTVLCDDSDNNGSADRIE